MKIDRESEILICYSYMKVSLGGNFVKGFVIIAVIAELEVWFTKACNTIFIFVGIGSRCVKERK